MNMSDAPKPLLVNGEFRLSTEEPIESIDPATGRLNHRVSVAGPADVDDAVKTAAQAAARGNWSGLTAPQRGTILRRIGDLMDERTSTLASAQMMENGKPFAQCLAQARSAAATFRYYAAVCETLSAEMPPARGPYLSMTVNEPYGVVAAITPWNSPLTLEAQKVAPALAAGNAVVLKPSELTASPALALGEIALEAGLPPGVLNVLPGTGAVTGAALVAHAGVKMISFTGGTATGRRIAGLAADRLIPVALELGGKSPHIVFADADLDTAVDAVVEGIFDGTGQSCVAGSRLFVQESVFQSVLDRVVARARALRIDLPRAADVEMGPLVSFAHRERVERMVAGAREQGARILTGGTRPAHERLRAGAFYEPTVVAGISNRDAIAQEEIFGPVLCVMPFASEEELVAQANDSVFGLAAGIWTADYRRAWRVARALEAGTVWVNTYKELSIATPFGGFKHSGLGREKGASGMRLYQQTKGIYFGLDPVEQHVNGGR
jgi:betaine-aldehyde dehydrogenase